MRKIISYAESVENKAIEPFIMGITDNSGKIIAIIPKQYNPHSGIILAADIIVDYKDVKVLEIESQIITSDVAKLYLYKCIELAKEAGYTHVKDNWGPNASDQYTIEEALEKFNWRY